jgi:hypothetical protein
VTAAVKTYAASRVTELDRLHKYGKVLRDAVEAALVQKAEDTFLWVSLVCSRLERIELKKALDTIMELPPGLHPFYNRILQQISQGKPAVVEGCIRLLKVMLLVYHPLRLEEIPSVADLSSDNNAIEHLIGRCASFIRRRGMEIVFIHQSALDYLCGKNGDVILKAYTEYGHGKITLSYLRYLTKELKVNLVDLPRPDSTRDLIEQHNKSERKLTKLASVGYAAAFWMQHLQDSEETQVIQYALTAQREVYTFLQTKALEWLECLSLLDELPRAVKWLQVLEDTFKVSPRDLVSCSSVLTTYTLGRRLFIFLLKDITRFLLRHYQTIASWPLQAYTSAIVFSPHQSLMRENNQSKIP